MGPTPAGPTLPPTPASGSREQTVLWSPPGTFESKPVRADRNSLAHPPLSFYSGENPRLREVWQSAQGHTAHIKAEEEGEKNLPLTRTHAHPTPGLLHNGHLPFHLALEGPSSPVF